MNPELERKVEAIEFRVKVVPEVAQHMVNVAGELNTTLLLKAKDIEGLSTALKEAYELGQLAEIEANATADITIAREKVEQIREEAYELGRKEERERIKNIITTKFKIAREEVKALD
jgi:hypothetical protein